MSKTPVVTGAKMAAPAVGTGCDCGLEKGSGFCTSVYRAAYAKSSGFRAPEF